MFPLFLIFIFLTLSPQDKHDDDGRLSIAVWAAASYVLVTSDCFSLSLYASSKRAFVVLGIVVLSSLPLQSRA